MHYHDQPKKNGKIAKKCSVTSFLVRRLHFVITSHRAATAKFMFKIMDIVFKVSYAVL